MLLPPRKHSLLERAYAWYGRRLLRASFARIRVGGAPWPAGSASVALVNHSAWWDPILALFLSHDLFRRDGYGIMDGAQLLRYPFFRRIGCFGVTEASLPQSRELATMSAALLNASTARTLWLFPQGALLPARVSMRFRSGAARIALAAPGAAIVPVAVRYEPGREQRPEIVVRVGEATTAGQERASTLTRRLEELLSTELAQLDADVANERLGSYRVVLRNDRSLSRLYDRAFGRGEPELASGDGPAPRSTPTGGTETPAGHLR